MSGTAHMRSRNQKATFPWPQFYPTCQDTSPTSTYAWRQTIAVKLSRPYSSRKWGSRHIFVWKWLRQYQHWSTWLTLAEYATAFLIMQLDCQTLGLQG